MSTCLPFDCVPTYHPFVRVRAVVTEAAPLPPGTEIPFPDGAWFTVEALCTMFGITRNYMYVLLNKYREHLTYPPVYRQARRRTGSERLLSTEDYQFLRTKFRVRLGRARRQAIE